MGPDFSDIFRIEANNVVPRKGRILISEPFSVGDIFRRSVVLLTEYSPKTGAMGLILNKYIPKSQINKLFLSEFNSKEIIVSVGGPMDTDKLFYVHTNKDVEGALEIMPGIYWGGEYKQIKTKVASGELAFDEIRFFAGYSGWAPKQLENEIRKNSWLVKDVTSDEIFSVDQRMWAKQIHQLEEKYKLWTLVPEDPHLN